MAAVTFRGMPVPVAEFAAVAAQLGYVPAGGFTIPPPPLTFPPSVATTSSYPGQPPFVPPPGMASSFAVPPAGYPQPAAALATLGGFPAPMLPAAHPSQVSHPLFLHKCKNRSTIHSLCGSWVGQPLSPQFRCPSLWSWFASLAATRGTLGLSSLISPSLQNFAFLHFRKIECAES